MPVTAVNSSQKTFENVKEKHIETVMPKEGGEVIVVRGDRKGETGIMLTRDKKKDSCQI